mmetsp:Transcript_7939/g.10371  ORF Transcript_7939/g.10371 Transcript_7939/m.10371 type:complete len:285 (-) Transcript_7939:558-1412(-)
MSVLWNSLKLGRSRPFFVIAGTNVIENERNLVSLGRKLLKVTSKLGLPLVFKASFDKANRTSLDGFRGPGLEIGLQRLQEVKSVLGVPILTDVHETYQVELVSEVADVIQIPSFLCRQTDLIVAAANSGRIVHLKKGQFASVEVMERAVEKVRTSGNDKVMVCERGSSWGVEDLVFDPRQIVFMRRFKVPVVMDCTHVCQRPAGFHNPGSSSGYGNMVPILARAAVAIGIDGVFIECHDDPAKAPVDGNLQMTIPDLEILLSELVAISKAVPFYRNEDTTSNEE